MEIRGFLFAALLITVTAIPAQNVENMARAIDNLRNSGVKDYQKIKEVIDINKQDMEQLLEETQNVMEEMILFETTLCQEGIEKAKEVINSGMACLGEAIGEGIKSQVKIQINCFRILAEFEANFSKIGLSLAVCGSDVACMNDSLTEAQEVKEVNAKLVKQNMEQISELKMAVISDAGSCFTGIADGLNKARNVCAINVPGDTSVWLISDVENDLDEAYVQSADYIGSPYPFSYSAVYGSTESYNGGYATENTDYPIGADQTETSATIEVFPTEPEVPTEIEIATAEVIVAGFENISSIETFYHNQVEAQSEETHHNMYL